jgi:hypothetical protein
VLLSFLDLWEGSCDRSPFEPPECKKDQNWRLLAYSLAFSAITNFWQRSCNFCCDKQIEYMRCANHVNTDTGGEFPCSAFANPYAASAAKVERRVVARGVPSNHAATRTKLSAVGV